MTDYECTVCGAIRKNERFEPKECKSCYNRECFDEYEGEPDQRQGGLSEFGAVE